MKTGTETGTTNWRDKWDKFSRTVEADFVESGFIGHEQIENFIETEVIAEMIEEIPSSVEYSPTKQTTSTIFLHDIKQHLRDEWLSKDYEEKK